MKDEVKQKNQERKQPKGYAQGTYWKRVSVEDTFSSLPMGTVCAIKGFFVLFMQKFDLPEEIKEEYMEVFDDLFYKVNLEEALKAYIEYLEEKGMK